MERIRPMKPNNSEVKVSAVWNEEMVLVPRSSVKPLLVTIRQAQYMLGNVCDKTVRRMIQSGRLSRAMFSRKILIPYDEVERIARDTNLAVLDA
jgi:excisionase family DNA binding protein